MSQLVQIGKTDFRFTCQSGCTACCTQDGEVYLSTNDVARMARHLQMTLREFRQQYCERDGEGDWRLTTPAGRNCHFLLEGGCSIHAAKPVQCLTFPFWPENVRSRKAWNNLRRYCPGIGIGNVLPVEEVRLQAQLCQDAFPDFNVVG